jgi:hypothetical protein
MEKDEVCRTDLQGYNMLHHAAINGDSVMLSILIAYLEPRSAALTRALNTPSREKLTPVSGRFPEQRRERDVRYAKQSIETKRVAFVHTIYELPPLDLLSDLLGHVSGCSSLHRSVAASHSYFDCWLDA